LDFLTLEAETDRLSRNVGVEVPLYTAWYLRWVHISLDGLVIQALVWFSMVQFRAIHMGIDHFAISCVNLRQPHIFKLQI
jgi:hypothetical protein